MPVYGTVTDENVGGTLRAAICYVDQIFLGRRWDSAFHIQQDPSSTTRLLLQSPGQAERLLIFSTLVPPTPLSLP